MLCNISGAMPIVHLVALMAISAFASWLQALAGCGGTLVAVPLVSLLIEPSDAVITVFLVSFRIRLLMVGSDRHAVQSQDTWRLSVAPIAAMPIGGMILAYVSNPVFYNLFCPLSPHWLRLTDGGTFIEQTEEIRWWHAKVAGQTADYSGRPYPLTARRPWPTCNAN